MTKDLLLWIVVVIVIAIFFIICSLSKDKESDEDHTLQSVHINSGYLSDTDIENLCGDTLPVISHNSFAEDSDTELVNIPEPVIDGYIYVITNEDESHFGKLDKLDVKIGFTSKTISERVKELNSDTTNYRPFHIILSLRTSKNLYDKRNSSI